MLCIHVRVVLFVLSKIVLIHESMQGDVSGTNDLSQRAYCIAAMTQTFLRLERNTPQSIDIVVTFSEDPDIDAIFASLVKFLTHQSSYNVSVLINSFKSHEERTMKTSPMHKASSYLTYLSNATETEIIIRFAIIVI